MMYLFRKCEWLDDLHTELDATGERNERAAEGMPRDRCVIA
jgi:hypothetical protein